MSKQTITNQMVKIPRLEYELLREAYRQLKRQALILRILEAEKNLKKKRVKEMDIDKFIKNI
ncbi:MAG TPA: hypothetical protein ENI51_06760 [Candidatus Atribacteria bacterium]|nr:hypothetical protein [Candidatus Atribacteria bacterium]